MENLSPLTAGLGCFLNQLVSLERNAVQVLLSFFKKKKQKKKKKKKKKNVRSKEAPPWGWLRETPHNRWEILVRLWVRHKSVTDGVRPDT